MQFLVQSHSQTVISFLEPSGLIETIRKVYIIISCHVRWCNNVCTSLFSMRAWQISWNLNGLCLFVRRNLVGLLGWLKQKSSIDWLGVTLIVAAPGSLVETERGSGRRLVLLRLVWREIVVEKGTVVCQGALNELDMLLLALLALDKRWARNPHTVCNLLRRTQNLIVLRRSVLEHVCWVLRASSFCYRIYLLNSRYHWLLSELVCSLSVVCLWLLARHY